MDQIEGFKLVEHTSEQINLRTDSPGVLELHPIAGLLVLFTGQISTQEALEGWEANGKANWLIAAVTIPSYVLWNGNQSGVTVYSAGAGVGRGYIRISEC